MDYFVDICGFLGAWLLVAGPIYQAALELREQEVDREEIAAATSTVQAPARISPWWWLLPPVAYLLQRRQSSAHRRAVMEALGPEQLRQTVVFLNKANGWFLVAGGAFFIAVKETWQLVELLDWSAVIFWVLLVVMVVLGFANTAYRMWRSDRVLGGDEKAVADRLKRGVEQGDR